MAEKKKYSMTPEEFVSQTGEMMVDQMLGKAETQKKKKKAGLIPRTEYRSARIIAQVTPTTYNLLKTLAEESGVSMNAAVNYIVEKYLEDMGWKAEEEND